MTVPANPQAESNTIFVTFVDNATHFALAKDGPEGIHVSPIGNIGIHFEKLQQERDLVFQLEADGFDFAGFFAVPTGDLIPLDPLPIVSGPVPGTPFNVLGTSARNLVVQDTYDGNEKPFSYWLFFRQESTNELFFADPEIKNEGGMGNELFDEDDVRQVAVHELVIAQQVA